MASTHREPANGEPTAPATACRWVRGRLAALHDGELRPAHVQRLRSHLAGCAACTAESARTRRLLQRCSAWSVEGRDIGVQLALALQGDGEPVVGELQALRAEVEAMRSEVRALRAEVEAMRPGTVRATRQSAITMAPYTPMAAPPIGVV